VLKADANDTDFGNKVRCVRGMTAVPETTDYDTIARRYSAKIDDRPWNALYERRRIIQFTIKSAFSIPDI